jgi:hypothetical protein
MSIKIVNEILSPAQRKVLEKMAEGQTLREYPGFNWSASIQQDGAMPGNSETVHANCFYALYTRGLIAKAPETKEYAVAVKWILTDKGREALKGAK